MDHEDLAQWFEGRRPALQSLARRLVGSQADAEDIVQDAWLKSAAMRDASVRSPGAWMTTAVRNLALDHLRHRRVAKQFAATGGDATERLAPSTEEALTRRLATAALVLRIVRALDRQAAAALLLHVVFDEDHASLAARIGKSTGATRVMLHRARRWTIERTPTAKDRLHDDRVEATFTLCWQAIAQCDPTLLHAVLDEPMIAPATARAASGRAPPVRVAMVLVGGRYVLAMRQAGRLICVLPVGAGRSVATV